MSYNGVGLLTPRGSGTNGYVQRNLSYVRARAAFMSPAQVFSDDGMSKPVNKKPNKCVLFRFVSLALSAPKVLGSSSMMLREILEHDRRRQVEVQLLIYQEELEKRG